MNINLISKNLISTKIFYENFFILKKFFFGCKLNKFDYINRKFLFEFSILTIYKTQNNNN